MILISMQIFFYDPFGSCFSQYVRGRLTINVRVCKWRRVSLLNVHLFLL